MKLNIPNKITIAGILIIPLFILVLKWPNFLYKEWVAAGVFLFASLTDFADGLVARKLKMVTKLGKFLDLLRDKLLISAALIFLINKGIQPWMAYVIIAREFSVLVLRALAASEGEKIKVSMIGKFKTVTQCAGILMVIVSMPYAQFVMLVAVAITLYSGYDYYNKLKHVFDEGVES